jgi:hypothetical protein
MNNNFFWEIFFFYWYSFIFSQMMISFFNILIGIQYIDPIYYISIYLLQVFVIFIIHDSRNLGISTLLTLKFYILYFPSSRKKIIPAFYSKLLHFKIESWIIKQFFLFENTLKLSDISINCEYEDSLQEYIVNKFPNYLHQSREVYSNFFNFLNISFKIACILRDFFNFLSEYFRDKRYDQECVICIELSEAKVLQCGHCFCSKCVSKMKNCPICRSNIDKNEIKDIHNCIQSRRTIYR